MVSNESVKPPPNIEQNPLPQGWQLVAIREILDVNYGKGLTKSQRNDSGQIPVYGSSGITGWHNEALSDGPCIVVGRKGAAGVVHLSKSRCWVIDTAYFVESTKHLSPKYIYYALAFAGLGKLDKSTTIPSLRRDDLYDYQILIPPLNEQHRIVDAIEEQ